MGVRYDFSDFDKALAQTRQEVKREFDRLGSDAVVYARKFGTYRNVTGKLRASNTYTASERKLVLENTAPYASNVEQRGKDVLSGAYLHLVGEIDDNNREY